jgi:phage shock protein E
MHWTWWHFWPAWHCDESRQPWTHCLGPPQPSQTCPPGQSESELQPPWSGAGAGFGSGAGGGGVGAGVGAGAGQLRRTSVARTRTKRGMRPSFPGGVLEQSAMNTPQDREKAHQMVAGGAKLVDVRTPNEFASGHIDGAVNIPLQELPNRFQEIGPPATAVVVYCAKGPRSAMAEQFLRAQGFAEVLNLGGMSTW